MSALLFNLVTAVLMVLMLKSALALTGPDTIWRRGIPWLAVGLTLVALAAIVLQHSWAGAYGLLDGDPSKPGWWRDITSAFMQTGGFLGDLWNIVTLALIATLAEWFWGKTLTFALFAGGMVLPRHIGALIGVGSGVSHDPRNFAGSSGATYFLAATLAAALLLSNREWRSRLLALSVPTLGLITWFAQDNAHGLVAAEGFAVGALAWLAASVACRAQFGDDRGQRQHTPVDVGADRTCLVHHHHGVTDVDVRGLGGEPRPVGRGLGRIVLRRGVPNPR